MKFPVRYLILFIIFLLVGLGLIFFRRNPEKPEFRVNKHRNEPTFQHEGKIYFLNDLKEDTLSVVDIEIVDNQKDIMQGLMFRSHLGPNQGMFFIFTEEEEQIFWMKNTELSLDIIFVSRELRIIHIAKHTVPFSKEPILSINPAKYVVEVNAGYCDAHQIKKLDFIRYDVMK